MSLKKYSRRPTLFVPLPSQGFYNEFPDETITKEIGVMKLTVLNELSLQNPEELVNGEAIRNIIKDCTNVGIDAKQMMKMDVDFLLVAINSLTHDEDDELNLTCPHCKNENVYSYNVNTIMNTIKVIEEKDQFVEFNDEDIRFKIFLRPSTFEESIYAEHCTLDEQKHIIRMIDSIKELTIDEINLDKEQEIYTDINNTFSSLTSDMMQFIAKQVLKVEVYENENLIESVSDYEDIYEFISSADRAIYDLIKDKCLELNSYGVDPVIKVKCREEECSKEFDHTIMINRTDFFVKGS